MTARSWYLAIPLLALVTQGVNTPRSGAIAADENKSPISWKKTVVDKKFRSEGVAIADVNKDGKMDILAGDIWYEAPDWKMHEIRKVGDYGDGLAS